ncbi:MAG TPA: biotin/lipoyl-binding protein, partial [Vicinamibacteria bacterium]|nr:biotin/lipoyl-binding protein [Vicinamibacteria bacterium]
MTRKVVFRAGLVLLVVALGFGVRQFAFSSPAPSFRFVTVERGDIQSTVSTTGTLGAVTTVNVGTQVSGQVSALYADFNDHVKKGQVLLRL